MSLSEDVDDIRKKYRIMGISAFDTIGTIAGAYLVSKYWNISFTRTLVIAFIGGELVHLYVGAKTPITDKIEEAKK